MVKETCLCGVSVHKGTLIAAIVCLIGSVLVIANSAAQLASSKNIVATTNSSIVPTTSIEKLIDMFHSSTNTYPVLNLIISIIGALFIGLLIYGNRTRKPEFYRPFLILMVIDIILGVFAIIGLFVCAIVAFVKPSAFGLDAEQGRVTGLAYMLTMFFIIFVYWLHFYFYLLVPNRSRKLLIEEQQALGGIPHIDKEPVI
ncbi:hypothetical protein M3Y97_01168700 [Aphelenchoides bicaudatus]|nr:hypothetical protein M3Y97_01168700 [Aphelenchoides bicaudatus]